MPRLRRSAHPRDLCRRSARRTAPAAGRGDLRRNRGGWGGIVSTVGATRAATETELIDDTQDAAGRNAGLRNDHLRDQERLRPERRIGVEDPARDRAASRGASDRHRPNVPRRARSAAEFRDRRDDYVNLVIDDMIPAIARLVSPNGAMYSAKLGCSRPRNPFAFWRPVRRPGLRSRIHADELGASGGSQVAARVRARSADHLIFAPPEGIAVMASGGRDGHAVAGCGVLLEARPLCAGARLHCGRCARGARDGCEPGRRLFTVDAIRDDARLFCDGYDFEEALVAATINAAWSLDRSDRFGSLEPGKQMDAVLVNGDAINLIRVGAPAITAVIKRGACVPAAWPRDNYVLVGTTFHRPSGVVPLVGPHAWRRIRVGVEWCGRGVAAGNGGRSAEARTQSSEDVERLAAARAQYASISDRLALLMDRDSGAYDLVVEAFRLPKSSDEERRARSIRIQEALRFATEVPLDVMRACAEAMVAAAVVAAIGNANASSDVQVGSELLSRRTARRKLNVAINLASMKDRAYVEAANGSLNGWRPARTGRAPPRSDGFRPLVSASGRKPSPRCRTAGRRCTRQHLHGFHVRGIDNQLIAERRIRTSSRSSGICARRRAPSHGP